MRARKCTDAGTRCTYTFAPSCAQKHPHLKRQQQYVHTPGSPKRAPQWGDGTRHGGVGRWDRACLVASCGTHVQIAVFEWIWHDWKVTDATGDVDATSGLPIHGGTSVKASTPSGRWGGFMKASAHRGLVVVDIAAVERDCAAVDVDATSPLPNNKARQ